LSIFLCTRISLTKSTILHLALTMQSQSHIPTMPSELTPASVAALISNSLRQQADQFAAIISDLQTQLNEFKDLSSHKKKLDLNDTPDTSSKRNCMKPSPSQNAYTTPLPAGKPLHS
ncbi:hypothetical protein CROQUDRAFT_665927, partial [Cronartium quercuum f. sp. fusiforme G11]